MDTHRSPLKPVNENKPVATTYVRSPIKAVRTTTTALPQPPLLLKEKNLVDTMKAPSTPKDKSGDKDSDREEARQLFRKAAIYFHTDAAEHVKSLRDVLQKLGASIEGFLTKTVTLIISNGLEELQQRTEPYDTPNAVPSPLPNGPEAVGSSVSQPQTPTSPHILYPAKKTLDPVVVDEFLQRARTFGIKIWSVQTLMQNIKRTGKWPFKADHMDLQQSIQHEKTYGLSTNKTTKEQDRYFIHPFIMVGDVEGQFRPVHKEFVPDKHGNKTLPKINYNAPPSQCIYLSDNYFRELEREKGGQLAKKKEKFEHVKQKFFKMSPPEQINACRRLGPVKGYCEHCNVQFNDIAEHATAPNHIWIIKAPDHYASLDQLFGELTDGVSIDKVELPFLYTAEELEQERSFVMSMDVAIKAEENIVVVTKHTEETAAEHMEILSEEARSPILCGTPTEGIPVTPFNLTNVANMHMCASGVAPTTPAPFSDVVSPQHNMVRSSSKRKHDDLGLATPDSLPQQNKRRQMDCLVVGEEENSPLLANMPQKIQFDGINSGPNSEVELPVILTASPKKSKSNLSSPPSSPSKGKPGFGSGKATSLRRSPRNRSSTVKSF